MRNCLHRGVVVVAKDLEQGVVYENEGIKVTAFVVDHGPVEPALGYRIDFAGRSIVLSGDTRYSENLIHFSDRTDVLIHEVIDPGGFRVENPSTSSERTRSVVAHHTTPGGDNLHPGKAAARRVFAHRARRHHRLDRSHAKNVFRPAGSRRRLNAY